MRRYWYTDKYRHKRLAKPTLDGLSYDIFYPDDYFESLKPFERRYSYFFNCFNCSYFRSLSSNCDFCVHTGFTAKFSDIPCEDFSPVKLSFFYK